MHRCTVCKGICTPHMTPALPGQRTVWISKFAGLVPAAALVCIREQLALEYSTPELVKSSPRPLLHVASSRLRASILSVHTSASNQVIAAAWHRSIVGARSRLAGWRDVGSRAGLQAKLVSVCSNDLVAASSQAVVTRAKTSTRLHTPYHDKKQAQVKCMKHSKDKQNQLSHLLMTIV